MARPKRAVLWVVIAALALALLAVAAFDANGGPQTKAEREFSLAAQFACPVCDGQSIADSDVPIAREIRKEIRVRLEQGQTDEDIRSYLVGIYGENIDLLPKASGVTGLVWFLPVFALVLALAGLAAVFRKWRGAAPAGVSEADRDLVAGALARAASAEARDGHG